MDPLVQRILFYAGTVAVIFTAGYSLYVLWEEHTLSGRCFAAERTLERHKYGTDLQKLMNLEHKSENRKRAMELCLTEQGVCLRSYSDRMKSYCSAQMSGGG